MWSLWLSRDTDDHDPPVVVFVFGWDVGPALNRNVDDARFVGPVLKLTTGNFRPINFCGRISKQGIYCYCLLSNTHNHYHHEDLR